MTVIPFEEFEELDESDEYWNDLFEKVGQEKIKTLSDGINKCIDYSNQYIVKSIPELDYWPKDFELAGNSDETSSYFVIEKYHIKSDAVNEVKEIGKKLIALKKEKHSPVPNLTFEQVSGENLPCLIALIPAKSEAQFIEMGQKHIEVMGDEFMKILAEARQYLRSVETLRYQSQPKMTYVNKDDDNNE